MNDIASDRVGPMLSPPHPGELIRESMDDAGWKVTGTSTRMRCERGTLSRRLNGKAGVSANMALALEDIGCPVSGESVPPSTPRSRAGPSPPRRPAGRDGTAGSRP